jgi:hypothetical protein
MAYPQAASVQQGGTIVKVGSVSPRCFHTGGVPAAAAADFNDTTVAATSMFTAEIYIPAPVWATGISVLNGSVVTNGNTRAGIFDASGKLIASTAATASAGVDSYQKIPFNNEFVSTAGTATTLIGRVFLPAGTYYIGAFGSSTSDKLNTHVLGSFGAGTVTVVNATALATTSLTIAPPTTFTTAQGIVASLY